MQQKDQSIDSLTIPYKKGYLPVSDGYRLYYECCGNPAGKPVLFIHGGPGSGFSENDKRFFDLSSINLILYDQRGAGRSEPFACLENNTTQQLVGDISRLLDFLHLEKVFLFGGSWGSTLALIYAIQNPDRVTGMLLRGIFLANKADIEHYIGGGVKNFFPEAWERFVSLVPESEQKNIAPYYLQMMQSRNSEIREKYTYEWARYEMSIFKLDITEMDIQNSLKEVSYRSLSPLEAHYIAGNCFISENYIIHNAHKISHIPTSIIHGRYDFICPPVNAVILHRTIDKSRLSIVTAGHSSSERAIERNLKSEMKRLAGKM